MTIGAAGETLSRWIHDLKAPVTAVEGYTQLLLRSATPLDEKQRRFIEGIGASCKVLFILIGNLKLEQELEQDNLPSPTEFGEIDDILRSTARQLERAFASKKAVVRVTCSPEALRDKSLKRGAEFIERTAANLLVAALHTSDEGAEVTLSADRENGEIVIGLTATHVAPGGPGRGFELSARLAEKCGGRSGVEDGRLFIAFPEEIFA